MSTDQIQKSPGKHARSGSEAFWLQPVMAIMASTQPESGRIMYMPDPTSCIRFSFILAKKAQATLCKIGPDLIWSGWPGQVWAKRIWSRNKLVCKNHWAQFWQNATGLLPVSHFLTWLHSSTDGPDNIVHNQPGSNLVLADRIRFWTNGSSQEASRCARITQPASGQCF